MKKKSYSFISEVEKLYFIIRKLLSKLNLKVKRIFFFKYVVEIATENELKILEKN